MAIPIDSIPPYMKPDPNEDLYSEYLDGVSNLQDKSGKPYTASWYKRNMTTIEAGRYPLSNGGETERCVLVNRDVTKGEDENEGYRIHKTNDNYNRVRFLVFGRAFLQPGAYGNAMDESMFREPTQYTKETINDEVRQEARISIDESSEASRESFKLIQTAMDAMDDYIVHTKYKSMPKYFRDCSIPAPKKETADEKKDREERELHNRRARLQELRAEKKSPFASPLGYYTNKATNKRTLQISVKNKMLEDATLLIRRGETEASIMEHNDSYLTGDMGKMYDPQGKIKAFIDAKLKSKTRRLFKFNPLPLFRCDGKTQIPGNDIKYIGTGSGVMALVTLQNPRCFPEQTIKDALGANKKSLLDIDKPEIFAIRAFHLEKMCLIFNRVGEKTKEDVADSTDTLAAIRARHEKKMSVVNSAGTMDVDGEDDDDAIFAQINTDAFSKKRKGHGDTETPQKKSRLQIDSDDESDDENE